MPAEGSMYQVLVAAWRGGVIAKSRGDRMVALSNSDVWEVEEEEEETLLRPVEDGWEGGQWPETSFSMASMLNSGPEMYWRR